MLLSFAQVYELVHALTDEEIKAVKTSVIDQAYPMSMMVEVCLNMEDFDEVLLKIQWQSLGVQDVKAALEAFANSLIRAITTQDQAKAEEVNWLLQGVNVMYEKRQFDMCVELLEKARTIAAEHELMQQMENVLAWEKLLAGYNIIEGKDIKTILRDQIALKEQLANFYDYNLLNLRASQVDGNILVAEDRVKHLRSILKDPLLQSESQALTPLTKLIYNSICAIIYHDLEIYENAYHHYQRILELYQEYALRMKNNLHYYFATINNFADVGIRLGKYNEVLSLCEDLKNMPQQYAFMKVMQKDKDLFIRVSGIELQVFNRTLMLASAKALIPLVEDCLNNLTSPIQPILLTEIYYQTALTHFLATEYEQSLAVVQQLYAYEHAPLGIDNQLKGRFLELLTLIELADFKQLKNRFHKTQNWLSDKRPPSRYELLFLDLITAILNVVDKETATLQAVYHEYIPLFQAIVPLVKQKDAYLDIVTWLESKVKQAHFASVYQHKINTFAKAGV